VVDMGCVRKTNVEPTSPRNAFSLATSGGWNVDWAFSKYCIGAMVGKLPCSLVSIPCIAQCIGLFELPLFMCSFLG
jgi:hypothetical protein